MIPSFHKLKLTGADPFVGRKKYGLWTIVVTKPFDRPQWATRIGKRIDSRAVVRNKFRRQLNQWLYRERENLIPQQFLVILKKKPASIGAVMDELREIVFKK